VWVRLSVLIGVYEAQSIVRQNLRIGLKIKKNDKEKQAALTITTQVAVFCPVSRFAYFIIIISCNACVNEKLFYR
jgi:hypothetical protein